MMRQMRDNMKLIMSLTAVTFVGLMVFGWGMDITGRTSNQATGGELGRVNGEPVTYEQFRNVYQNLYDQQQRALNGPISTAMNRQIEDAAWNQVVMQKLVNQELERRGIEVSESEIKQAAQFMPPPEFMQNPAFQTDGKFDLTKYHGFMASPQADDQLLMQLEGYYREYIPRSKLFYQTTTGVYLPDSELWRMWRDARETARVRYIFIDPAALIADNAVNVTPREVETYYREHKDEFEQPSQATVKFVSIDRSPTAADTAAARAKVAQIRQELSGGGDFAAIARRESSDSISAAAGGELGKMQKGRTVPAFETAVFSLPLNQLSEPVATQFGYHLIQVKSRTADEADVRHILIPIKRSEANEDALLERADSLESLGTTMALDEVARRFGLAVRSSKLTEGLSFLPGVGAADDGAIWALDDAAVGEVSEVFESATSFYMLEIVDKVERGVLPLESARASVTTIVIQQKKLEEARRIGRQIVDAIRAGQTMEQAASAAKLTVQEAGPFTRLDFVPGMGRANAAIGTAFGLKPGTISGLVEAEGALFVIQAGERTEADRTQWEAQKAEQQGRVTQAVSEQRWNQFLAALREDAKIVDNRAEVLRRTAAPTDPLTR